MGSAEKVKSLASKIPSFLARINCETLTKTTLVEPLLQILGYDVGDLSEVWPKYASTQTSTVSDGRQGVDYALVQHGTPAILIVCRWHEDDIESGRAQLAAQFEATDVRLGILTDGLVYRIYADTVCRHQMDERPFLVLNLLNLQDSDLTHLVRLSKFRLKVEEAIATATELLEQGVAVALNHSGSPSAISENTPTSTEVDRVLEAIQQTAASPEEIPHPQPEVISTFQPEAIRSQTAIPINIAPGEIEVQEEEVATTSEERDGFYRLRSLLWREVNPDRLMLRATQHCCEVLLDSNRLQPICIFYFARETNEASSQTAIGIPHLTGEGEGEDRIVLETLDRIGEYWERFAALLHHYESCPESPQTFSQSTPTQLESTEYPYSYQNRAPEEGGRNFATPMAL